MSTSGTTGSSRARKSRRGGQACYVLIALAAGATGIVNAMPASASAATESATQKGSNRGNALAMRVAALTKALELDSVQQTELLHLLEHQREQIMSVWNDATVPAVYRVSATRAIGDRTANQIRALLTAEQLKKYNPAPQIHDTSAAAPTTSTADWISVAQTGHLSQSVPQKAGASAASTVSTTHGHSQDQ